MNISPETIRNGNRLRRELASNPATFGTDSGVAQIQPNENLDQRNGIRMAGQMGARALELMQNPQEAQRVDEWMNQFGQSVPGREFNAAKLQQAQQMADQNAGVGGLR